MGIVPRALLAGAGFLLVSLLPVSATAGVFALTAGVGWASLALVVTALGGIVLAAVLAGVVGAASPPRSDPAPLAGSFVVAALLGLALGVNAVIHLEQAYQHWYGVPERARVSLVQVDEARRGVHCRYVLGGIRADQWSGEFPVDTQADRAACEAKVGTTVEVMVDPRRRVRPRISEDVRGIGTALWVEAVLLALAGLGGLVTAGLAVRPARSPRR
ncbi:unnamed protein product [[Actinomadura] parvosata subsp. kistnae]|uniref:DUF3592 domain-containing protein n=1 Tax=[Actinomadura] parvosata subsp. kistnae TaxID=1909395 RepID=A0A1U9ZZR9_9ACTN|nr:hypothetical protein [Nonomuraea sp. ATCC 55076]AQZ63429.1 hypothetical protein BKM31_19925 [Nonomuraea sp. ATCC 55076]SPL99157.1 unnamed protein product [Actinomadura parvosata subsp. kistnae]